MRVPGTDVNATLGAREARTGAGIFAARSMTPKNHEMGNTPRFDSQLGHRGLNPAPATSRSLQSPTTGSLPRCGAVPPRRLSCFSPERGAPVWTLPTRHCGTSPVCADRAGATCSLGSLPPRTPLDRHRARQPHSSRTPNCHRAGARPRQCSSLHPAVAQRRSPRRLKPLAH